MVSVCQQMVRSYCCCYVVFTPKHIINSVFCCDMFKHNFEARKIFNNPIKDFFNEDRLSIKNIDFRVSHFAMNQQRHFFLLHGFKRWININNVCYRVIGISG